jgi:hypothetical protein
MDDPGGESPPIPKFRNSKGELIVGVECCGVFLKTLSLEVKVH